MVKLLGKSRVWGKGYTTVPVTVRKVLGVNNGDEIEWYLADTGDIVVRKCEKSK